MEKMSCNDSVRNEVLQRVEEERNVLKQCKVGRLTGLVTSCVWTAF